MLEETLCPAYNDLGTIPMEEWLYDENHFPVVDNQIYYFILGCNTLP